MSGAIPATAGRATAADTRFLPAISLPTSFFLFLLPSLSLLLSTISGYLSLAPFFFLFSSVSHCAELHPIPLCSVVSVFSLYSEPKSPISVDRSES